MDVGNKTLGNGTMFKIHSLPVTFCLTEKQKTILILTRKSQHGFFSPQLSSKVKSSFSTIVKSDSHKTEKI